MKLILALVVASAACALSTPVDIDPFFDAYRDVRMLLITRQNRLNPHQISFRNRQSILNSPYDPNRPTRVLIHGWLEDEGSDINVATAAELLNYYDSNIILIDWSEGSQTINYIGASNRVEPIGRFVGSHISFMVEEGLLRVDRLKVIGFSLGAHIAGFVGKTATVRLHTIIGLDPAGPLFSSRNPLTRIDRTDAEYVEIMHTNGPTLLIAGAGIGSPIGDADFWPNGGSSQPGCITNTCSHGRAVDYYVESIANNRFFALRCPAIDDISSRRCTLSPGEWMGGEELNFVKTGRGSFYLDVNRNSPHAQGPQR